MSAVPAGYVPQDPNPTGRTRPTLQALSGTPRTLARLPFVLVLISILGLGMAGVLVLNTKIQEQQVRLESLQAQAMQLGYRQDALQAQVNQLSSVTQLGRAASQLGMRPNPYPAMIVLPAGTVVGTPQDVKGNEMPVIGSVSAAGVGHEAPLAVGQPPRTGPMASPSSASVINPATATPVTPASPAPASVAANSAAPAGGH